MTQTETQTTTRKPTTREVIAAMLKENTGRHFLDSDGAYGRNWERNQTRDFDAEPHAKLTVRGGRYPEVDVTFNTYHWLCDRLEFAADWQEEFDAFAAQPEQQDEGWLAVMEAFMDRLKEQGREVAGIYGDGDHLTINTYNDDCCLSQTLQFVYATVDGEEFVLLQIHGGCDVRGGYTAPKAFRCNGNSELAILDYNRATIGCDKCEANWMLDGSSWLYDGGSGGRQLGRDFPIVAVNEEHEGVTMSAPAKGLVLVREDGMATCPCCAEGTLGGYWL